MRRTLLASLGILVFNLCPAVRADSPESDCCSNYPIYLCRPGFLGYPLPPYELAPYDAGSCRYRACGEVGLGCGQVTPNPYSCCFYGVTLSNYGLISPVGKTRATIPGKLPTLPATSQGTEKLPKPAPK